MRTQEDILQEINTSANAQSSLNDLQANKSKVSWWNNVKSVIAFSIFFLEKLFDRHKADVNKLIATTEAGTLTWYKNKSLEYQEGDVLSVIGNQVKYSVEDISKRIITRVSISENTGGVVLFKVAKGTPTLEKLTVEQLAEFTAYLQNIKFAGTRVATVSKDADVITITAVVEITRYLFESDGTYLATNKKTAEDVLVDHFQNYEFDKPLYLSKVTDAVQTVEGVKDFHLTNLKVGGVSVSRKIILPAGYARLDIPNSTISYVFS